MSQSQLKPQSRLIKNQHDKLWKRTMFFSFLAIGLLLVFIFLVLPNFFRLTELLNPTQNSGDFNQNLLPIQRPVLSAIPQATNSASLQLEGFVSSGMSANLVWDGNKAKQVGSDDEGRFVFSVLLQEGDNRFSVYASDKNGRESEPSSELRIFYSTSAPELVILSPESGSTFEGERNRNIRVEGKTDPGVRLMINNRLVFPNPDGAFSHNLRLNDGENQVSVEAIDVAGNKSSQSAVYHFASF